MSNKTQSTLIFSSGVHYAPIDLGSALGREFDIAKTYFEQKAVPRGGNLTFPRCPRVGNFTLGILLPGSARPPPLPAA